VTYTVSASDNCLAQAPTVSCSPTSGSSFPLGTTTVNCTATDGAGNQGRCSFTVTVNDCVGPTINCPADIVTNVSGTSANVSYATPTGADTCSTPTVQCSPASGSSFALGTNTVTCTATDAATNSSICRFKVILNRVVSNKPTVTITASDAAASEPGSNVGKFKFTRTGPTNAVLTVNYTVSGTATPGVDYKKLSGQLSISAGKFTKSLTVTPLDDNVREVTETVKVTLSPSTAYNIGSSSNATVNIQDND
jgi:hypothetical protein